MALRPAVFLDRDGTLNVESGYIRDLDVVRLYPRAAQAVRRINDQGWLAVLVTNQSGPARGYYSEEWVHQLNQRVVDLLAAQGARLDHLEYCPHLPPDQGGVVEGYARVCDCRKPAPGMVHRAAELLGIDLSRSVMIGDKGTDVLLGVNAGTRSIFLRCGHGEAELAKGLPAQPDFIAPEIGAAVEWIFRGA